MRSNGCSTSFSFYNPKKKSPQKVYFVFWFWHSRYLYIYIYIFSTTNVLPSSLFVVVSPAGGGGGGYSQRESVERGRRAPLQEMKATCSHSSRWSGCREESRTAGGGSPLCFFLPLIASLVVVPRCSRSVTRSPGGLRTLSRHAACARRRFLGCRDAVSTTALVPRGD